MTKAIMLDVTNKTITEIELGDYKDIQDKIGCRCFAVIDLGQGVDYLYDDEGLLNEAYVDDDGVKHNMFGIQIKGYPQVVMGNALISGHNNEGETIDCPISKEQIASVVTFVEYDNPEDKLEPQMGFISF